MTVTIAPLDPFPRLDDVYAVYARALDGEVAPIDAFRETQLARHAPRDAFVFLGASEGDALVGIAYGYRGRYGQWWTDNVGAAMDDATRREWLDPPHFEVVELHVHPDRQRHDRALLTMNPQSPKATAFYAREGWSKLTEVRWTEDAPPRFVLGKRVAQGT